VSRWWRAAAVLAALVLVAVVAYRLGATGWAPGPGAGSTSAAGRSGGSGGTDPETGLAWVAQADLPKEARETIVLIQRGGPYPYRKDGATFGNRERLLPQQASGYYREYTVPTPGEDDRGARRIVTGDDDRIFFYTDDHYQSFRRVRT